MYSKERNKLKEQMMNTLETAIDEIFTQMEANQLHESALTGKMCDIVLPQTFKAELKLQLKHGSAGSDYKNIEMWCAPTIDFDNEETETE